MFGAILSAITGIPALIDAGTALYESIAGKPTTAKTPEALIADVQNLPPDQQKAWADAMHLKIEEKRLENARIQNEQGDLTPDLLKAIPPEAAAEVAIMRATTRPWTVRKMVHVILLPVYVLAIDMGLMFLNGVWRIVTKQRNWAPFDLFAEKLFGEGSLYTQMYNLAAPTAAAVVISYITAKSIEAVKGSGGDGVSGVLNRAVSAVSGIVTAVKGGKR